MTGGHLVAFLSQLSDQLCRCKLLLWKDVFAELCSEWDLWCIQLWICVEGQGTEDVRQSSHALPHLAGDHADTLVLWPEVVAKRWAVEPSVRYAVARRVGWCTVPLQTAQRGLVQSGQFEPSIAHFSSAGLQPFLVNSSGKPSFTRALRARCKPASSRGSLPQSRDHVSPSSDSQPPISTNFLSWRFNETRKQH